MVFELIQETFGHESISTTLIYSRITAKKRLEVVARNLEGERRLKTGS
jgi:site-specific recombinase XerD